MAERITDPAPLQPLPVTEVNTAAGSSWIGRCLAKHGRWALVVSLLIVLPTWLYLRGQKAVYEATILAVLPFSIEANAEASDSDFGLKQARTAHVAMLRLYIDTLERNDLISALDLGRVAQLRRKLKSIADELEKSDENHRDAIRKAADKTFALYEEFDGRTFNLPTISPMKDGAVLMAVDGFCRTSSLFEHTMKEGKASLDRKAEMCEYDCMNSRRAFLVILCRWKEFRGKDREVVVEQFVRCQNRSLKLTQELATDIANVDQAKAITFQKYAKSMQRRLDTVTALRENNYVKVIQILRQAHAKS